ncbi:hypothetical protein ACPPVO_52720 [Dactylosporangium sp. McL0621]|uniref:hypothetical protein n=1 Tax=Dactylosporangium sp. McL0621 TaxID=3415678 RepID=UPI003CECF39A
MGRHEQRHRAGVCIVRDPRRAVPRWPWLLPPLGLALLPVGVAAGLFAAAMLLLVVGACMRYGQGGVRIEGSALPEWQAAEAALREVRLRWPALGAMAEPADIGPTLDITRYNLARLIAARVRLRANLDELRATRKDLGAGHPRGELRASRDESGARDSWSELYGSRDGAGAEELRGELDASREVSAARELGAIREDSGAGELRSELDVSRDVSGARELRGEQSGLSRDVSGAGELRGEQSGLSRDVSGAGELRGELDASREVSGARELRAIRDDSGAEEVRAGRWVLGGGDLRDELDERIEAAEDRLRDLGAQLAARTAALGRLAASLDAHERREVATARARVLLAGDMPGATLLADPFAEVGERTAATLAAYRELSELRPSSSAR